ncbi:MAG TPA: hypothetical protein VGB55_03770 [Tepidisphaeraceae bacterium]|jgi:hypothetical protein
MTLPTFRKFGAVLVLLSASTAYSQTIYPPVQFQYFSENQTFYYGGDDPVILRRGAYFGLRPLENEPTRIYTDALPNVNAANYGFTIDDARNEAYAALPRYYRKADGVEPETAVLPSRDNTGKGTIEIKPYVRPTQPPPRVLTLP